MSHGFDTLAVHAGQDPDPRTGSVIPPIYQTSTYAQDAVGAPRLGYEYSRSANPSRDSLQAQLAAIEGGRHGLAFASGLAAEDAILRGLLKPGDHVVFPGDAYGGTYRLFARVHEQWGIGFTPAKGPDVGAMRNAAQANTKMVWVETPTNPLLNITDLAGAAQLARDLGALLVVDNTFASPYLQQPLSLGADIVVHSTTKYLGGHSDVIGGGLVLNDDELAATLKFHQNAMGAVNGPFDAWLTTRGIKTLGVRMDRHCDNAERIAEFLIHHKKVTQVYYPGLPDHPGHETAAKQMRRFGGMVSFRTADAEKVCNSTELFILAESLGGVESLIEHPGRMTHASVAGSPLEVRDDLVRLSVGIETVDDLLADLDRALS
ncbi:cystathionine gamma-synthase [Virgisporangium ochraceum]|uniref:Cystathionine gamma-synthase n=1 Tax=Virgisporangium ochraceum TaxID=65505 RepID=A0A8J3ZNF8_9ACTN|nr:cystathionine gamma-synthase [Virgisporangium ochraceum]GIJ65205.1 cystathionine gamma-synthase [Virgisporangium ochraceum]